MYSLASIFPRKISAEAHSCCFKPVAIKADNYEFNLTDLQAGFNELERQGEEFSGLFADIDLNSTKLGSNAQQRNVTITEVLRALDEIDLFEHNGDVIGDAYEYLIGMFGLDIFD